jgi:7-carboxy-7-deazaguanine synthase
MRVFSVFKSINGECSSQFQGSLCTFIRLAGCNLNCSYCDTPYAQLSESGIEMSIPKIMSEVYKLQCKNVVITGGEPLLQKEIYGLIECLKEKNRKISIETNGSLFMPAIDGVSWVADWKCKSSGMEKFMNIENFVNLSCLDIVKFVIADREDFDDALHTIERLDKLYGELFVLPRFAFSPIDRKMSAQIIEWMKENKTLCQIGAIFSLQIHKVIYPNTSVEV